MKPSIVILLLLLGACSPARSSAEADYLAQQLACVDRAATREDAVACRNAVKAAWATTDGGAR